MLKNVYEGLNARPKVYLSKEYFCKMYPTCVSSKLCEFISSCFKFNESENNCFGYKLSEVKEAQAAASLELILRERKIFQIRLRIVVALANAEQYEL